MVYSDKELALIGKADVREEGDNRGPSWEVHKNFANKAL
jgi:hypothetical protein